MDINELDEFMGMSGGTYLKLEVDKFYTLKLIEIEAKDGKFGKTLEYTVITEDGEEKKFSSGSKRLWYGLKEKKVCIGDTFRIMKTGQGTATNWKIDKIDNNKSNKSKDDEINLDNIPM